MKTISLKSILESTSRISEAMAHDVLQECQNCACGNTDCVASHISALSYNEVRTYAIMFLTTSLVGRAIVERVEREDHKPLDSRNVGYLRACNEFVDYAEVVIMLHRLPIGPVSSHVK